MVYYILTAILCYKSTAKNQWNCPLKCKYAKSTFRVIAIIINAQMQLYQGIQGIQGMY
jgi:hypothetical protein